jgi:predicted MPP superfamily phosphohydrolase
MIAELVWSNSKLTHAHYTVSSPKVRSSFRIVFISDLHGREFGKNNERLLGEIAAEQPDIIALAGDIIDARANKKAPERLCEFISALTEIAPVYYGMGNHEYYYMKLHGEELREKIASAGAVIVDGNYVEIELGGTQVRIGGYEGYYRTAHLNTDDPERIKADDEFFNAFEDTEGFKLLINHIPTNWLDWEYRDRFPVDLVFSGHYHGGIVRIPLIGQGLYAPYVGWFPKYTKGCFEGEKATCVLSTGLAGANGFPRLFNPPEIVTVDVLPEDTTGE